jgi:hypothetical protein
MNVKEILKFADDLMFEQTEEHLDDFQEAILRGTLDGKKYSKVAEEEYCTEGHVRDVAYELWSLLSKALGEDVNKSNFRSAMERSRVSNLVSNHGKDYIQCIQIEHLGTLRLSGDDKSSLINGQSRDIEQKTDRNGSGVSMHTVTVTPELEIFISSEICKELGVAQGQKFQIAHYGDRIELVAMQSIKNMRGFLKGIDTTIERELDRV